MQVDELVSYIIGQESEIEPSRLRLQQRSTKRTKLAVLKKLTKLTKLSKLTKLTTGLKRILRKLEIEMFCRVLDDEIARSCCQSLPCNADLGRVMEGILR
jgi:hypothetical protein